MSHLLRVLLDELGADPSALDRWLAYARKFGTEFVYEAARDELDAVQLDRLAGELRALDRTWTPPGRRPGRPRRRPALNGPDAAGQRACRRCGRALSGRADRRYCSVGCRVATHRAAKLRPEVRTPPIRPEFSTAQSGVAVTNSGAEGNGSRAPAERRQGGLPSLVAREEASS